MLTKSRAIYLHDRSFGANEGSFRSRGNLYPEIYRPYEHANERFSLSDDSYGASIGSYRVAGVMCGAADESCEATEDLCGLADGNDSDADDWYGATDDSDDAAEGKYGTTELIDGTSERMYGVTERLYELFNGINWPFDGSGGLSDLIFIVADRVGRKWRRNHGAVESNYGQV